jgi:hypothetical protein
MTNNRTTAESFHSQKTQDRCARRIVCQRRTRKETIMAIPVKHDLTFMANTFSLELFNGASRRRYCKSPPIVDGWDDTASPEGTILHL